jgi:hypothetical protein
MQIHEHIHPQPLERAVQEDILTALLHRSLDTSEKITANHPALDLLRSLLSCKGLFQIPVLDLAAVLPDAEFRDLTGLHIASYYGEDANDRWYMNLLEDFFSSGRGSLLALRDFNESVGKCHFFSRIPEGAAGIVSSKRARTYLVTEGQPFLPKQQEGAVTIEQRFSEYAKPLLSQFEGPSSLAWISFGPRPSEKQNQNTLRWGGSLFAVILANSASQLRSQQLSSVMEDVYGILNASFYRTIVDRSRQQEAAHRLRLTYFAFGHDLKNRIERIEDSSVIPLQKKICQNMPALLPDIDQCHSLLQVLAGMCGVFSAVAKVTGGLLPNAWIGYADGEYTPTKAHREALSKALVAAVTTSVYVEDSVDPSEQRLVLRRVHNGIAKKVKRPQLFRGIKLPPFNPDNDEPHLCFLSGLAELCRNAARFVLDTPKIAMKTPHVDFSVEVTDTLVATVILHNPVVGEEFKHSKSIRLLAALFRNFDRDFGKVVEIGPAEPVITYLHGLKGCRYVQSRFVYYPMNLRFEE